MKALKAINDRKTCWPDVCGAALMEDRCLGAGDGLMSRAAAHAEGPLARARVLLACRAAVRAVYANRNLSRSARRAASTSQLPTIRPESGEPYSS